MIPQIEPWIDHEELDEIKKVINSSFITENKATENFETLLKELTGAKHAIAMANGTLGLCAILEAAGIGEGDEVIVPDLTFIATSNAILYRGATPRFCDIDFNSLCLNPEAALKLINKKTRAILPVHLYGLAAEMTALREICSNHNLLLIEDGAQGVGVRYHGKHVGHFGLAGILSFYGNKTITTGEGGAVLTNDDHFAKECYKIKNHGRERKGIFIHESIGSNYSFTDLQAAIGIAQLRKLDRIIHKKQNIRDYYIRSLSDIGEIKFQEIPSSTSPVFWFTNIHIKKPEQLAQHLSKLDIGSRRYFYPLHKQPCYKQLPYSECPISLQAYETGLSLPSSYNLEEKHLEFICNSIRSFYGKN